MALDAKNYLPPLMYGADIGITAADISVDDLTVGDDATIAGDLAVTGISAFTGAATFTGAIVSDSTTDTTSGTTGAIQTDGGVGVAKAIYVGTTATIIGATNYKRQVTDTGGAFATPIVLTTAQSGRFIIVDDAAGLDFTLPAIAAADVGTFFDFYVTVTITSNSFRVTAASGDLLFGAVPIFDFDTANTVSYFAADGTDDLIFTCNGGTTGGKKGSWVRFTATSATQWCVQGVLFGDGSLATPFA